MSSFQEMLPTQAYEYSQIAGSAGEGVSLGWLKGTPLRSGTSDKRLVLEGGGCANTAPTQGGYPSFKQIRFPCQRPHSLSSQKQLWISQHGRDRGSISVKVAGQWLVSPLSRENKRLVPLGSVHMKVSEVTKTHRISGQGLIL